VELFAYLLLGVIQGLTEFLPVSSSGHLVLAEHWLKMNPAGVTTEVALHVATLLSVVIVYRRDIALIFSERRWNYLLLILLGTIMTVVLVLPFKDQLAALTEAPYAVRLVGGMLLVTALWLTLADVRLRRGGERQALSVGGSLLIGVAQALAALPGISRSGATIGAGVQLGMDRTKAARFSFLLSVPVIAGAGVLTAFDVPAEIAAGGINPLGLGIGFIAALICGIIAIHGVLWLLQRARLSWFALYCALLGVVALAIGQGAGLQ